MVIHNDDDEAPTEVSIVMRGGTDQAFNLYSSDVHITNEKKFKMNNSTLMVPDDSSSVKKPKKKRKKSSNSDQSSADSENDVSTITQISQKDLLELRSVYKQCKTVMRKIERKYGHLLDIDNENTEGPCEKRRKLDENSCEEGSECQCTWNKKIVFDEDGKEVSIDTLQSNHICPTKLMLHKNHTVMNNQNQNVQIEYHNQIAELSDNMQELQHILKDPSIETTYRNQVIDKLKLIKQEHLNEIRFNKLLLIEKLRSNPDEILSFNGSNLSVLAGYSIF